MTEYSQQVRDSFPTVNKFRLCGPDGMRTPHFGLFTDEGESVGKPVSSLYVPHTTEDVVAAVDAVGDAWGGIGRVSTRFKDGHHVIVQPSQDYRKTVFGSKDDVFPRLVVRAPYGGKGSFSVTLGFYRDLCRNMMILRRVSGTTVRIRHTGGLRDHMDEMIASFAGLQEKWENLGDVMRAMEDRRVNVTDYLNAIYGEPDDTGRGRTIHRNRTEAIVRRLFREQSVLGKQATGTGSDLTVSGWDAFNAVQGYIQHDRSRQGSPDVVTRAFLALGDSNVARAEALVYEMAL